MAHRDKRIILAAACLLLLVMNALVHIDFSKTALGCSTIFLSISHWFNENEPVKFIFSVFSSYFGFKWLFNAIVGFYTKPAVWSYFNRDVSLDGDWIYVFDDSSLGCAIYGYFKISHSIDGLSIKSARCWYSGTSTPLSVSNQRGIWSSKSVSQSDGSCYIFYEMHINNTAGKPETIYYGVMMMSVDYDSKLNTKLINGTINDHGGSVEHTGMIYAKRLKNEDYNKFRDWDNIPSLVYKYLDRDVVNKDTCKYVTSRIATIKDGDSRPLAADDMRSSNFQ